MRPKFTLGAGHCKFCTSGSETSVQNSEARVLCSVKRAFLSGLIEGFDRDQVTLFPERLEDWIGEDDLVRVIDLFVDQLDLVALGFARAAHARTDGPDIIRRFS